MNDKEKINFNGHARSQNDKEVSSQGISSDQHEDEHIVSDTESDAQVYTLEDMQKQLQHCQAQVQEWKEQYTRINADFQNYTQRMAKEQATWRQRVLVDVCTQLLPIVDDFERAFEQVKEEHDAQITGFQMIYKSLIKLLEKHGVHAMHNYETFDPQYHEALVQEESAEHVSGTIIRVLQKGYTLHDTVLRPAKVSVAK